MGAVLSHATTNGQLTISATCVSPACGRCWKVYGVKVRGQNSENLPRGVIVADGEKE
jgi:hypothetical protein